MRIVIPCAVGAKRDIESTEQGGVKNINFV